MKIHPAVHVTWIGAVMFYLSQLRFISDVIEKLYDKTAWLRDLIRWEHGKKKRRKKR